MSIVVTNPPFSLFRDYVSQLIAHEKQFLIIGNNNAITYKEVFKLIKANQLWLLAPMSVSICCSLLYIAKYFVRNHRAQAQRSN